MALSAPGVATHDAPSAESAAFEKAVLFHCLKKVFRAGRRESAARAWATNEMKNG